MRTTIRAVIAALLLAGAAVGCSSGPSYEEVTKRCADALKAQYAADGEGKPDECKDVKKDDYAALVASAAAEDLGWLDEDGEFDENKMLDDVTEP
ncbi:hypothetical protein ACFVTT_33935 [Streptomyces niveus]|uniref:hypothetical protein n=1 Tax=Streptomyces niveus TaxID=193462 RepID=UPI003432E932